jgi:molecular chaperone GrpE (heat shock protein)
MTQRPAPELPKWPFLAGDFVLLVLAWWIVSKSPNPFAFWPLLFLVGCVAGGAWIAVVPFLAEFRAALRLSEADGLASVVEKINQLEAVADQVGRATGQWQEVQDKAGQTVIAAREIAERMTAEARAFAEFMKKASDSEKAHLRLEAEKLHRAESEWVQVLVLILDHVHALHLAGLRSGKAGLIQQLAQFQRVCRESARRVGLVPIEVAAGDTFDDQLHMLEESQGPPSPESCVAETLAPGYTFQGQFLRKSLVRLATPEQPQGTAADLFRLESETPSATPPAGAPATPPPSPSPTPPKTSKSSRSQQPPSHV